MVSRDSAGTVPASLPFAYILATFPFINFLMRPSPQARASWPHSHDPMLNPTL
ncbi:hypothetical protein LY78DRAFT_656216 [Colletotrichum sublineola]|nr:hypothetical protein LY78DRAFT_656216 [Colletotrichum sublineola]